MNRLSLSFIPALILAGGPVLMAATPCEKLASLSKPDMTVTSAQVVAAGAFTLPVNPNAKGKAAAENPYKDLPPFCRVALTLKPSSDSDIKVELWLPEAGWNQKFQAVGNGGWAGVISYTALAEGVRRGYATSSTDTGHSTPGGSFAFGHPEKLIDFGWRSEHEMTVKSKELIEAFYGNRARLSYWNGCSTGGRQGLKEAQKFPNDFDGIVAGAPANRTGLALWIADALFKQPGAFIPDTKYSLIHKAALEACDATDGLKDGLIDNPAKCKFDPKVIECKGTDGPACLTTPQVKAAQQIYTAATNPRTGKVLFPSLAVGSELGWAVLGAGPGASPIIWDQYRYVAFKDPKWDWKTFDFDKDIERSETPENLVMNSTDPDMSGFFSHNGKLLLYHGWSDPNITPYTTIEYYRNAVDKMGGTKKSSDAMRLFLAPGMGHCRGGEGPDNFDVISALENWVEKGKAPDSLLASHAKNGAVDRTRPLCPYPQVAKYKGNGSIDDAANFACTAP